MCAEVTVAEASIQDDCSGDEEEEEFLPGFNSLEDYSKVFDQ